MTSLATLDRIQRRVLWLATWMVHHANAIRPAPDATKIGGHQASSASAVSLLTALYFGALGERDAVAVKAHASPAFYAIQYLLGRLSAAELKELRSFGGLQAYPSHRKNPDIVDLSTGSMGLGAVQATFGALATRYLADHAAAWSAPGGDASVVPERYVVMVGDAELDEGNVWEALAEEVVGTLGNVLWIVDVNRQSLDRIVPDARRRQLPELFGAFGWRVIELRHGARRQALFGKRGGAKLRARLDAMPYAQYQALLRLPPATTRKALIEAEGDGDPALARLLDSVDDDELVRVVADVGGHDLGMIRDAFAEAERERDRPTVIVAHTIKGWGLPLAGDQMNHTALLTTSQIEAVRASLGVAPGAEWDGFPADSAEAALIRARPPLFAPPARRQPAPDIPEFLDETYPDQTSSQEAFGRVLGALGRRPEGDHIVTVSADVAVTTHLAGWINRKGIYFPEARSSAPADAPQAVQWKESPAGQHVELGIAEHNLFLLLGALGLSHELSGIPLLPIGTLYDPFVTRGLDALYHALYSGSRFVVVATPSGVSLSPEGGAHQSVITPGIGVALPAIVSWEPVFAREVEWVLLAALRSAAERRESAYLRLSTKPIDQRLAPPGDAAYRARVLRGGYRLIDGRAEPEWAPDENAVHIFASGVMVPEAIEASGTLRAAGLCPSVFVVTSPDLLYRGLRGPRPYLEELVTAEEEGVPIVSVLDGHSHGLAFLGSALGVPQIPLGVDDFGQSGTRADLYRHYGIDAPAIAAAARTLLGG